MRKYDGMISDVLMVKLTGNANLDRCDMMRVNMFTMDAERVSNTINHELPKEMFIDDFCNKIVNTSGYASFNGFCRIDREGIRDIGCKVFDIIN